LKGDNLERACIIDTNSSEAILLADAPQAGELALSALHMDPALTFRSFSDANVFEYNTLISLTNPSTGTSIARNMFP
jgi:hypothetical protein